MKQPDYLTDEELKILWPKLNDWIDNGDRQHKKMAFYVALLLSTGMRCAEAAQLKLEGCLTQPQPVIWLEKEDSQTKKHARWVGIFPPFRKRFAQYIEERKQEGGTYLFPGYLPRQPIQRNQAMRWWTTILKEAGIRHMGSHAARRTFATWMPHVIFETEHGPQRMNSETLSQTLGHSRDIMFKHYQKPMPGLIFPGDGQPEWVEYVGQEPLPKKEVAMLDEWRKKRKEKE